MHQIITAFIGVGVSFFLLNAVCQMMQCSVQITRCVLAAALAGIICWAGMLNQAILIRTGIWLLLLSCLVPLAAFGFRIKLIAGYDILLLLVMGMVAGIQSGACHGMLAAASGMWILCRFIWKGSAGKETYVPLTICYKGKQVSMLALRDTGNMLRDPITGEPVLLISGSAARKLTGLELEQLKNPLDTIMEPPVPGLRLIPYRTVGCSNGFLLAMRFSEVQLGRSSLGATVAFAAEGLGEGQIYQALVAG